MRPSSTQDQPVNQQVSGDPIIRSFPNESRRAPMPWSGVILSLAGLVAIAAGTAMIVGPERSPEIAGYAARLQGSGILAGHLFAAGCALGGLGLLAFYLRKVAATLLAPGAAEDALCEVGADLAEYRNKLYEFENDHLHFRAELEATRKEVREHRDTDRSPEAVDALFHMAGSLDTLHARLDQRMSETSQGLEQTMRELGGLVESSRDYLQESLEQGDEHVQRLTTQVSELAGSLSGSAEDEEQQPEQLSECEQSCPEEPEQGSLSLGLLDQFDDGMQDSARDQQGEPNQTVEHALNALDAGDHWSIEMPELPTEDEPELGGLKDPRPPLPSIEPEPSEPAPTALDRMEQVVKNDLTTRLVEGLDLEGDQAD